MQSKNKRRLLQAAGIAMLMPRAALADSPIRFSVAFAAGGIADTVGRIVAQKAGPLLTQPVIVENRPGAGGNVAAAALMTGPTDGSAFLVHTAAFAINATVPGSAGYDPMAYVPVSLIATTPEVLATSPENKISSLREFIQQKKGKPVNYSTAGIGSSSHLTGEYLLKRLGGLDAVHVPYQGGAPAVVAAAANQVDLVVTSLPAALQQIRQGRLVPLAVAGAKRTALLPEVPTAMEIGFKLESLSWVGVFAPPGTSRDIAQRFNKILNSVVQAKDVNERLLGLSFDPANLTTSEFAAFVRSELEKWRELVRAVGLIRN